MKLLPSSFLSSLDPKDRKLLLWCVGIGIVLAIATGFLLPNKNDDDNPMPSSYASGKHGALAAYELLVRASYPIERWERPLSDLAATAGPETVVIFAQPFTRETEDIKALRTILDRGGRVLVTGYFGGSILPGEATQTPKDLTFGACKLEPEGLDPLASSGEVWMVPAATWQVGIPAHRVDYSCAGQPAIVEFDWGQGHAIWWASSTPLENASIARAANLDLFLNSIGQRQGHRFYWDESLHGQVRSTWSYAAGPSLNLLRVGLLLMALLIVLSFSRRRGPVRELPAPPRTTPVEFLDALGGLYRNAGAASTAVTVAWERFRRNALRLCGLPASPIGAADLAAAIHRRFPQASASLDADLAAAEAAASDEALKPGQALRLIQALHRQTENLTPGLRPGVIPSNSSHNHSNAQERPS